MPPTRIYPRHVEGLSDYEPEAPDSSTLPYVGVGLLGEIMRMGEPPRDYGSAEGQGLLAQDVGMMSPGMALAGPVKAVGKQLEGGLLRAVMRTPLDEALSKAEKVMPFEELRRLRPDLVADVAEKAVAGGVHSYADNSPMKSGGQVPGYAETLLLDQSPNAATDPHWMNSDPSGFGNQQAAPVISWTRSMKPNPWERLAMEVQKSKFVRGGTPAKYGELGALEATTNEAIESGLRRIAVPTPETVARMQGHRSEVADWIKRRYGDDYLEMLSKRYGSPEERVFERKADTLPLFEQLKGQLNEVPFEYVNPRTRDFAEQRNEILSAITHEQIMLQEMHDSTWPWDSAKELARKLDDPNVNVEELQNYYEPELWDLAKLQRQYWDLNRYNRGVIQELNAEDTIRARAIGDNISLEIPVRDKARQMQAGDTKFPVKYNSFNIEGASPDWSIWERINAGLKKGSK